MNLNYLHIQKPACFHSVDEREIFLEKVGFLEIFAAFDELVVDTQLSKKRANGTSEDYRRA